MAEVQTFKDQYCRKCRLKCWTLFFSHNWGEKPEELAHMVVKAIGEQLESVHCCSVWIDERQVYYGDRFEEKILPCLCFSKFVVVFLTRKYVQKLRSSNAADLCQREFNFALEHHGFANVFPILLECIPAAEFQELLSIESLRKLFFFHGRFLQG